MVTSIAPTRKSTYIPTNGGCKHTTASAEDKKVACKYLGISDLEKCLTSTNGTNYGNLIPTQIGLLTSLTSLFLYASGTMPTEIGCLTKLKNLISYGLIFDGLVGSIPSSLGR
jgi:hypothetical protein